MNHTRQLLLKNDPHELSVCAVAAKVGFWDVGRFAGRYRRFFGELPSETLGRRSAGT
jgi:AraC family ethanolamine operon transcriptional activator